MTALGAPWALLPGRTRRDIPGTRSYTGECISQPNADCWVVEAGKSAGPERRPVDLGHPLSSTYNLLCGIRGHKLLHNPLTDPC